MQNYEEKLAHLKAQSSFRSIKNIKEKQGKYIIVDDKKMLNLSSNDYLNLSTDSNLKLEFIEKYKNHNEFLFSSASARLLTGSSSCYKKLENNFAKLFNKESALLFNTGYQANQGVISALFQKGDVIFSDKLNHASIVSGLKLSPAEHFRYNHNNYEHLEKILKEKRDNYNKAIIISESVFSMDGDIADIQKLVELKKKYNCLLMIDEAHAFGVFGENLQGISAQEGQLNKIDIITITLGKALASSGAICISNKTIIDYLINKASSFIFSTAIAPANAMWSNFLLEEKFDLLKEKKEKLNSLFQKIHKIYPSISSSQIVPIVLGSSQNANEKAKELQNKGFYVLPINPPTVPLGTSRLRISLTSDIEFEEICNIFG
ncbi:MAG: 8-amino-7-oxononanoate synthase [Candidatus Gastranaerophilales bacterium]|nr:8-amino-7-oxononanoate synthase [Candidatus Gastranaerophilales bacterium]